MTDITGAEAAEVLWASSEQGKAAVRAALDKAAEVGIDCAPAGISEIRAIVYAAHLAAGRDGEVDEPDEMDEPEQAACAHQWSILAAQESVPPGFPFVKPGPHTAVLTRCRECGQPESWLLTGAWTLEDLQATGEPR